MGIFGPAGYMTVNLVEKKINGGVLEIPDHTESYSLAGGTGGTGADTFPYGHIVGWYGNWIRTYGTFQVPQTGSLSAIVSTYTLGYLGTGMGERMLPNGPFVGRFGGWVDGDGVHEFPQTGGLTAVGLTYSLPCLARDVGTRVIPNGPFVGRFGSWVDGDGVHQFPQTGGLTAVGLTYSLSYKGTGAGTDVLPAGPIEVVQKSGHKVVIVGVMLPVERQYLKTFSPMIFTSRGPTAAKTGVVDPIGDKLTTVSGNLPAKTASTSSGRP